MASTNNTTTSPASDRNTLCKQVYAQLCVGEANGTPVTLTGIRFIEEVPVPTHTTEQFTVDTVGVLAHLADAGGYTKDVTSFTENVSKTHKNSEKMAADFGEAESNIIVKRMNTGLNRLYRANKKAIRTYLRDTFGMDWWKTNKEANIERGVIHFYTATPAPAVEPVALIAPASPTVQELLAKVGVETVAPAPVETPAADKLSLEEMLAQFIGGETPTPVVESSTPVIQTEATKAELIAAVIASGKFPTMDERQLNSLNKDSLESLLA
tara:strand:+ start:55 stop:858 length:804 start_codon:yes stop_codon:yes gene_type:complete